MSLSSMQRAGVTLESIKTDLPEGVEIFFARHSGQIVFRLIDPSGPVSLVALIYKKAADGTPSLRLDCKHDDGRFPPVDAGIVTDPDGWKFRSVKLETDNTQGQMKELAAAITELALA